MRVLHTEASNGFGGQEIRILREAIGMRERGHEVVIAVQKGGKLVDAARSEGFEVYELHFRQKHALKDLCDLKKIIRQHDIELINTHSSWDAWIGGMAARLFGVKVLRTRHLSTAIRPGLNSRALYGWLADRVVTTCEETAQVIRRQAKRSESDCYSVATGIDLEQMDRYSNATGDFRAQHGLDDTHIVVGTACVFRSWKGVETLIRAAKLLEHHQHLRLLLVGDGPAMQWYQDICEELHIQDRVVFTGYLKDPLPAIAAMDVFALLSTANEGVSQAVLQAAALSKPLVTTRTGGLDEVCLEAQTGFLCPVGDQRKVAECLEKLVEDPILRLSMGQAARILVEKRFTMKATLDRMEQTYQALV